MGKPLVLQFGIGVADMVVGQKHWVFAQEARGRGGVLAVQRIPGANID